MLSTTGKKRERWNAWPFPLRFNHPSTQASPKRSRNRGGGLEKRKMSRTMSSLCHPAHCGRHKSEQWCLSGGSLYAHLHWFGSSIHETGTLFTDTPLHQTSRPYPCTQKKKTLRPGSKCHRKKMHTFVSAPAHTCHLPPGLVIVVPVRWHRGVGGGGALCLGGWTLFVKLAGGRHSRCRRPAAPQRCRACKLLCLHAALTILTQMRSDNWGCSLINNIKMEGVSWWLHGPL